MAAKAVRGLEPHATLTLSLWLFWFLGPLSFYVEFVSASLMVMGLSFPDFIGENLGKIMILVGVVLLIAGVMLLNIFGSVLSAGSLFFGILLVVFGFFVQVGIFSGVLRSLNGFGTVLICLSVVFFAFSLVVFQFQKIDVIGYVQEVFGGGPLPFFRMLISSERTYLWLSDLCMRLGLVFFVAGLVLKVYYFFKP